MKVTGWPAGPPPVFPAELPVRTPLPHQGVYPMAAGWRYDSTIVKKQGYFHDMHTSQVESPRRGTPGFFLISLGVALIMFK